MRAKGRATKRKDGRWQTSVILPDGSKRYLYGKSQTAVTQAASKLRRSIEEGEALTEDPRTVAEYLTEWLEASSLRVKPSTHLRYVQLVRTHVVPALGKTKLVNLTPDDVQRLYLSMAQKGSAPRTIQHLHRVLRHALDQARRWGAIRTNPVDLVDSPRVARHEPQTLSAVEARALLTAARGHPLEAAWVLGLQTALREGQILGLRWQDVDLDRRRLSVRGTLTGPASALVFAEAKTHSSRHQILLTSVAVEALQRRRLLQTAERLAASEWSNPDEFVFTRPNGRPIYHRSFIRNAHDPLLLRAGLPRVTFHELRHSVATLLLGEGVHPKVVADLLGHSRISLTLDTYSHVMPAMQADAIEALERLFGSA